MKTLHNLITACILMLLFTGAAFGQDAAALIKEGVQLHDQKKYPEAIDKYQQALKIEPNNTQAEFELSFSLFSSGKGTDAIPHLEKVIKTGDTFLAAQACDILGSVYDENKQPDKAMEVYAQGIKLNPNYQRLRYNMALAFMRQNKYAEAETSAIDAIKLDPKHTSSQQLYAVALQGQGKKVAALFAYCSFLMLEPQGQRALAVNQQLQSIVTGSFKKTDEKTNNITLSQNSDSDLNALELSLSMAAVTASQKTGKSQLETLQDELTTLFKIAGELSAKKKDKDFFWKFDVDFLSKLANSEHMTTFMRLITLSVNQEENYKWIQANPDALNKFKTWMAANPRQF